MTKPKPNQDAPLGKSLSTGKTTYFTPMARAGYNHSIKHPRSKDGKYREGGPWFMAKTERYHFSSTGDRTIYASSTQVGYRGKFRVGLHPTYTITIPTVNQLNAGKSSEEQKLQEEGAKAWAKLKPDAPDFSAAVSLYELRDVPGMLHGRYKNLLKQIWLHKKVVRRQLKWYTSNLGSRNRRKSHISQTGEYYLALTFGWLALLKDTISFVQAQKKGQKKLDQIIRDAGRPVRRRRTINATVTFDQRKSATYSTSYGASHLPTQTTNSYAFPNKSSSMTSFAFAYEHTWCEGSFRYFLPPGPRTVEWRKNLMRRLMGARITPSAVYNMIPWSWLFDYFTGLGDFLEAISPGVGDRCVADYAYIMRTREWRIKTSTTVHVRTGKSQSTSLPMTQTMVDTTSEKIRGYASPFGFGIKQGNLSPMQIGILGALGLSKLP